VCKSSNLNLHSHRLHNTAAMAVLFVLLGSVAICADEPAPTVPDDATAVPAKKVPDASVVIEYSGKLVAMTKDEIDKLGDPAVIAKFEIGQDSYFVKSFNDGLKAQLVELIGHEATLKGKITNEGKYLMVLNIIKSGPGNASYPVKGKLGG
jgi:hypothetical protein